MARPATSTSRLLAGSREPCRVATTANIDPAAGGLLTIDGVTVEPGDRVLVKNQADATQNGIYGASAGEWYRASDGRSPRSINKGTTVHVQEGTANGGNVYAFQTLDPDIGADDIQISFYISDDIVADAESEIEQITEDAVEQITTIAEEAVADITDAANDALADVEASSAAAAASADAALASELAAGAAAAQAEAAAIASGAPIYPDTTAGLAAVADQELFFTPANDGSGGYILWLDDAGSAVEQQRTPYRVYASVSTMLAATEPPRAESALWEAEGFRYIEAAGAATDHHLTTAGGVKLYLQPGDDGFYNFAGMDPACDGVTDDLPKLQTLLDIRRQAHGNWPLGPAIYFPPGQYFLAPDAHGVQLKAVTHLKGAGTGIGNAMVYSQLMFASDSLGIVVNANNTLDGGTEGVATGGAAGSTIERLTLSTPDAGANTGGHGIWIRSMCQIDNVKINKFSGNGIHIVAGVGLGGAVEGNANLFSLHKVAVYNCGLNGVYCDGADTNAGVGYLVNCSANGRWGIRDSSFLGNTWVGCHTATNGTASAGNNSATQSAFVHFGGLRYGAHPDATEAELVATAPGTDASIWVQLATGGVHAIIPTWTAASPEGTYFAGGGYFAGDANARSVFLGCYSESDQPGSAFEGLASAIGGTLAGGFTKGGSVYGQNGNKLIARNGGGFEGLGTNLETVMLGGEDSLGTVLSWRHVDDGASNTWRLCRSDGDWIINRQAASILMRLTGELTTQEMGTGAPVPYVATFPVLGIGITTNIRRQRTGSAAPTTGAHARGDIVWNTSPAAAGFVGWVCTTAGTPGTWKTFGVISA